MALSKQASGVPLPQLLDGLAVTEMDAAPDVSGVSSDSRETGLGDLFLACKGVSRDGAAFIPEAIRAGASVIAIEQGLALPAEKVSIPVVVVPELAQKAGIIAGRFYQQPSRALALTGVTGTNGKTSICWWLARLHTQLSGQPCGLIGTLGAGSLPNPDASINTTPGAVHLQKLMAGFVSDNITTAFMEVSSHALDQGRTNGLEFNAGVFTNLSHDHLDYHGDLQSYRDSKARLFQCDSLEYAVINADDATGRELASGLKTGLEVITYSIAGAGPTAGCRHIQATLATATDGGADVTVHGDFGDGRFVTHLQGGFSVSNLLAVTTVLLQSGFSLEQILGALADLPAVPGRMEQFNLPRGYRVVVDYAHTPAALEQALLALRQSCNGKLICVFGCGGDRDRDKRPIMGEVAARLADQIVLTDDNPRDESAQQIIDDILSGIQSSDQLVVEHDRCKAISDAIKMARDDDVILIAGKGHETYQEIAGRRSPFSDRQQVRNCIEGVT
ncbi:MAG: UDP-N-acetylmuramoyl-L-alanyl-D-glutamate--2,6-diaminopimelate ligase [Gammaproteobacteria bacterium]